MPTLKFTTTAQAQWTALEDDPTSTLLVDRLNAVLDLLETNPSDPRCRRRRFSPPGVWCITVWGADEEYAVLWEPDATGEPVVVHLGPSTFA